MATRMIGTTAMDAAMTGPEFAGREQLRAHSREFRQEVIEAASGVYVAVGYSASNVALIRGEGGSIIVDTCANPVDARAIVAAFGDRLVRPVRAIIYTHNHPDHSGGASVFAGNDHPEIHGHRLIVEGRPDIVRGMRDGGDAFGMALPGSFSIRPGKPRRTWPSGCRTSAS